MRARATTWNPMQNCSERGTSKFFCWTLANGGDCVGKAFDPAPRNVVNLTKPRCGRHQDVQSKTKLYNLRTVHLKQLRVDSLKQTNYAAHTVSTCQYVVLKYKRRASLGTILYPCSPCAAGKNTAHAKALTEQVADPWTGKIGYRDGRAVRARLTHVCSCRTAGTRAKRSCTVAASEMRNQ